MCSNGLPYLFLRVTLFDRYYFVIILPEEEAEDHRDSVIFPWSPSQERDHVGIWIQVLLVPKPSVLSLTPQTTTRWSRIQQLPNKIDALKDTRKRSPVSHSPLLPAPLIGTKRHLSALCTSKEEPAHPIPSQDEVPAGVWGMLMAMTWRRVCTNLLGICFPLSPLPLPHQTLPPSPATCSFHEPITMARFFCSSEATGTANKTQMQQGKPLLSTSEKGLSLPWRTPSRRKVGLSNFSPAPKGWEGLKGQNDYEWSQKGCGIMVNLRDRAGDPNKKIKDWMWVKAQSRGGSPKTLGQQTGIQSLGNLFLNRLS